MKVSWSIVSHFETICFAVHGSVIMVEILAEVVSVLLQSYMEDHLKNKNRLEREWEALCSYQAEPGTCIVGQSEQNSKRNRSDTVVVCEYISVHVFLFLCNAKLHCNLMELYYLLY